MFSITPLPHSGSHPHAGRPGHFSTNSGSATPVKRSSRAPRANRTASSAVVPTPMTTPAPPNISGTHHAVSSTPVSRMNSDAPNSLSAGGVKPSRTWNHGTSAAGTMSCVKGPNTSGSVQ